MRTEYGHGDANAQRRSARRRRSVRWAAGLTSILAIAAALTAVMLTGGSGPRPSAQPQASRPATPAPPARAANTLAAPRHPRPAATFAIGTRTVQIEEPSGADIATATVAGQPVRALPTLLLYPATGGRRRADGAPAAADIAAAPFPLIVFSQGFDEPVNAYLGLLDAWVRAGFVVAAPTYPRTAPTAPNGLDEGDILNHPNDLRFVISTLISAAGKPGSPLAGLINTGQIAIAGQSDGGDVTLAAAENTCCRIGAVKAAVILSGAELAGFGGTYYGSGTVPLLVTQGDRDTINLPGCSTALYDQAPAPKYYADLLGAEHLPPYTQPGPWRNYVARLVVAFLDDYLRGRPAPLEAMLHPKRPARTPVATLTTAADLTGLTTYCL